MAKSDPATEIEGNSTHPSSSPLTATFLAIAAITTVVGFAAFFATWLKASIDPGQATLQIAAKQYALGHYTTATALAEQAILPEDEASQDLETLREYLIGAGLASEAMLVKETKSRRNDLHKAIPHLKIASIVWPPGREDDGDRLLGLALFQVGEYEQAISPLGRVVERNPTYREEILPVLAQCYLYGTKEDAQRAFDVLGQLDSQMIVDPQFGVEIECYRAQSLLKLGKYDQARDLLTKVDQKLTKWLVGASPPLIVLATKVNLLHAAADVSEAIDKYGKSPLAGVEPSPEALSFLAPAMQRLSLLQRDASPEIVNDANLWAARAYACLGQAADSLNLFAAVRQQQPFEGANIAAGIEEVEMLAEAGAGEEMLQTVRYLLREIGDEQNYDGSAVDLASFRARMVGALQSLRSKDQFKHCIAIAKVLPSLFPLADALFEEALTHQQDAENSLRASRRNGEDMDPVASMVAKQKYRKAGDTFRKSARLRFDTEQYCDTLWEAIDAYQSSGQFELCVDLLDDYLRYEDRRRQPRALLALGKARLATGDSTKALAALEECIVEFPRDPLRYDARLYSALAYAEAKRFDKARELLDSNLTDGGLTPESSIWKESLFSLGELLFRQGHQTHLRWALDAPQRDTMKPPPTAELRQAQPILQDAIVRLGEAATRYWPDPRAKHAAYLSARAHKLAAIWPRLESESADALDAAKRQLRQQSDQHLSAALTGFTNLHRDLATREEEQPLPQASQAMLRNCYIAEADTLYDLGRYEQSADAFRAVSLRYLNEPPSLEAMLGQSRCLQQLNRPREARLVIRQALVVLGRIPPEAEDQFVTTTRYDRKRWKELLGWLDAGPMPEDSDA